MQFTGHSLLVHQFVTVPWDFNLVPYCQPSSPPPMEYATHRLWNGMFGRVRGQYTTRGLERLPLLCISSHRGLYKFERLVFGVKIAPAIFQQVMHTTQGGLDFACAYLDDIVIASKSTEEHRRQIHEVFERIHNFGFRIKETKCEFLMNEIRYLGHIIDKNGRRPDPERA